MTTTLPAINTDAPAQGRSALKSRPAQPRLGFLGVGWIGRSRLEAIAKSGAGVVSAIADPVKANCDEAIKAAPETEVVNGLAGLLEMDLDGIVIATPSALHADQSIAALEKGMAVFCQKPLARNTAETSAVIQAARRAGRLLGVDLSYRHIDGTAQMRELIRGGELGKIFAADLVFHNAYGPDKPWFYDATLSGGGCVIDLGIHLVDLACWMLGAPKKFTTTSRLFSNGERPARNEVEDYAVARIDLDGGATAQLACSWRLSAGCDAVIEASFYGTKGGVTFRNLNGSFYDFTVERLNGTRRETIASGGPDWGGRAAVQWCRELGRGNDFNEDIEDLITVAEILDSIYQR